MITSDAVEDQAATEEDDLFFKEMQMDLLFYELTKAMKVVVNEAFTDEAVARAKIKIIQLLDAVPSLIFKKDEVNYYMFSSHLSLAPILFSYPFCMPFYSTSWRQY